jgi:hypothetical protein
MFEREKMRLKTERNGREDIEKRERERERERDFLFSISY